MPSRPGIAFKHPNCPSLVPYGKKYCEKHKALYTEEAHSAASRGYGSKWKKVRVMYLQRHSLCVECLKKGRYMKVTIVNYIVPHRGDQEFF